jgi:hypothetical protein
MISKHDYGCGILSFIVLFILSALSHFWFIMILICIGAAVWGTGAVLARMFLYVKAASFPGPGSRVDRENASWAIGMPNDVLNRHTSSSSPNIQIASQEPR